MCITIRQEIREYIIEDINRSLNRLGIYESLYEYNCKSNGTDATYQVRTNSIRQMPVVFDELWIDGYMTINAPNGEYNHIIVYLRFKYTLLNNRGSNGHELGTISYRVPKELPDDLSTAKAEGFMFGYVRKEKGLL